MGKLSIAGHNLVKRGSSAAGREMGKVGGKSKSPAKVLAAKRNGKKHVAG